MAPETKGIGVSEKKDSQVRYSDDHKAQVLAALAKSGGNVAETSRQTGINQGTIRRWWRSANGGASLSDLHRFAKDSWKIIHKANAVVEEKVEELGAKDAASIAAGYFDRQSKAEEQMTATGDDGQEYAAQWDSEGKK